MTKSGKTAPSTADKITLNGKKPLHRRLFALLIPYWGRLFAAFLCMLGGGVCTAVPAYLMKHVVDSVLIRKDSLMLNLLAVGVVLLFVFKALFLYGQKYFMGWVGQKVVMDMRIAAYAHVQTLSLKFINNKRVGELLSRVTHDANMLQVTVTTVAVDLVVQSVSCVSMLGYCFYLNWRLMIYTLLILPVVVFVLKRASEVLRRIGHRMQQCVAELSAVAEEALSAIRIVRSFATEELELEKFKDRNRANFDIIIRGVKVNAALSGGVEVLLIVALALIFWLGGRQVLNDRMTPGDLVAFLGSLGFIASPINHFTRAIGQLQYGFAAAERIFGLLDNEDRIVSPNPAIALKDIKGNVEFKDVSFCYESGQPVLKNLSISVKPGEKVAIVGATGAGKSTLVDLLQRFYDPQSGAVLIDGHDVKTLDLKTMRKQIGIVPQDPVLMKGTIAYNIAYGYDPSERENRSECEDPRMVQEIAQAAKIAGISDFIETLPQGYDTELGVRGVTVSGGQRQRIAIARAIIRNPRILILDEATSSLDAAVEHQIQEAMNKAMEGRTSIIIAHRLSTIVGADRILYLEGGRITEQGTHEQLMARGGAYQKLFALQYGEKN